MADRDCEKKIMIKSKRKRDEKEENVRDCRPVCPYGSTCYRKNPQHIADYQHNCDRTNGVPQSPGNGQKPACKYGANCYRKNLLHFAEFWHPLNTEQERRADPVKDEQGEERKNEGLNEAEADTDTEDEEATDFTDSPDKEHSLLPQTSSILNRGVSLLKSYSVLTEEERKELIKRALQVKDQLKEELEDTLNMIKEKNKELEKLRQQIEHGHLKVEGEIEAMEKEELVYFPLFPQREYCEGSAEQLHFRIAESQFYRLLDADNSFRVSKVEYVVNPQLVQRFSKAKADLKKNYGNSMALPVLAFHGTAVKNIASICSTGFRIPGDKGFQHATDTGFYGRGVYFSEYPSYSMKYIRDESQVLLCQVLPGKVFRCTKLIHGESLKKGYTSHTSPDGKEMVIFSSHHILPSYIVHYDPAEGDFIYKKQKT